MPPSLKFEYVPRIIAASIISSLLSYLNSQWVNAQYYMSFRYLIPYMWLLAQVMVVCCATWPPQSSHCYLFLARVSKSQGCKITKGLPTPSKHSLISFLFTLVPVTEGSRIAQALLKTIESARKSLRCNFRMWRVILAFGWVLSPPYYTVSHQICKVGGSP